MSKKELKKIKCKLIKIQIEIPDGGLDKGSVHQQIVYAVEDYIRDKSRNPERWAVEINGTIWNKDDNVTYE